MNQLALAIKIASAAFVDKTDKVGKPYILHCLRVMQDIHSDEDDKNAAAVLHDVVEDCPDEWSFLKLMEAGFTTRTVSLVMVLTHNKEQTYEDYIKGIALDRDATDIKKADLRDNSNITRLKGLTKKDFDRIEKYHKAYVYLSKI